MESDKHVLLCQCPGTFFLRWHCWASIQLCRGTGPGGNHCHWFALQWTHEDNDCVDCETDWRGDIHVDFDGCVDLGEVVQGFSVEKRGIQCSYGECKHCCRGGMGARCKDIKAKKALPINKGAHSMNANLSFGKLILWSQHVFLEMQSCFSMTVMRKLVMALVS